MPDWVRLWRAALGLGNGVDPLDNVVRAYNRNLCNCLRLVGGFNHKLVLTAVASIGAKDGKVGHGSRFVAEVPPLATIIHPCARLVHLLYNTETIRCTVDRLIPMCVAI